ncbi:18S rRNA maturation protein [Ceratobasidium sp. 395]|nr:18S rRNA maturation protein [Ceratobasidium sp. 395]
MSLAADVRIPTERRLKSLETDLAKAEIRRKERSMAVRYHKIKFFAYTDFDVIPDKQKITRKINQTKRALEVPELEKKERKKLQKALLGHRVDLNYIVNYPKVAKYIALYPSSTSNDASTAETNRLREERRAAVRQAMKTGEMDMEPETRKEVEGGLDGDEEEEEQSELEEGSEEELTSTKSTPKSRRSAKPKREDHNTTQPKKSKPTPVPTQQLIKVQEDDFFDT